MAGQASSPYSVGFASGSVESRFAKDLEGIPSPDRERIVRAIEGLATNPRPEGKRYKLLRPPVAVYGYVAECRLRIGDWRVLYDIDDAKRRVYLISLRRRSEKTYK